ncbi:MAG: plasminogen-binding N-terminal domain-containing protein [Sulfurovaceae bacterium]|nr:plasminogen-binding N-terminal domain-containing protein [Sulfurovaceae bacterium]
MRKFILMAIISLPLFADLFPASTESTITSTQNNTLQLSIPFQANGMSGIVIHKYDEGLEAATTYVVQTSLDGNAKIQDKPLMENSNLPNIATKVAVGDKVIGGYLYDNVMLLAPDEATYQNITTKYNKKWIHPDLYAAFMSENKEKDITKENLAAFAKSYQVGLIAIVKKGGLVIYDPVSEQIIAQEAMETPNEGQIPFFTRFKKIKTGWFGMASDNNYYNDVEQIR